MQQEPARQQIEAATGYEDLLVPALFSQWTGPVLDAAGVGPGDRVIDVACGTGVLARAAAERVGSSGKVVGVDPDPGMVAVAAQLAPEVVWRRGTAEELPAADGSFDALVSQFGLMFFAQRARFLAEVRRVLVPGGRLAVAVWDGLDGNPAYATEVALLERLAGSRAAEGLRLPFASGDRGALAADFAAAGLESVVVTTHTGRGRFPTLRAMVEADLRGWLPLLGIVLGEELIARILDAAEEELADHRAEDGGTEFLVTAHIVAARCKN